MTKPAARARRQQVRAHPLFAAAVALWFAALFGFCALVVPTALLEQVAAASAIERFVPAAAPPLGETAHMLVASALALGGAALGFAFGLLLAATRAAGRPGLRARIAEVFAPAEGLRDFDDLPSLAAAKAVPPSQPQVVEPGVDEPENAVAVDEAETVADESLNLAAPRIGPALEEVPVEALGLVQLTERLALAIGKQTPHGRPLPTGLADEITAIRSDLAEAASPDAAPTPLRRTFAPQGDKAQTERALHDALARLQRITRA